MKSCTANASTPEMAHIIRIAEKASREAGRIHHECRKGKLEVSQLLEHDIKLEADRKSEEAIVSIIRREMPNSSIISEEGGVIHDNGGYTWIIDPLDGTMNYYHRQHHFCTCIACYRRNGREPEHGLESLGEPIFGAVYAADYDELFLGEPGEGATLNGRNISVSDIFRIKDAIVTTSFGSGDETMDRMEKTVSSLIQNTRKVRIQGSCGLDICNVAAGRLSALYQENIRCWDFAAAAVILREAGGILLAEETTPNRWNVLASSPNIFEKMKELTH